MTRYEFIGILAFMALLAVAPIIVDQAAQAGGVQSFIRQHMPVKSEVDCE